MYAPPSLTQALMRSGMPHTRLSCVSAEMLHQADRTFRMSVASDVAGVALSTLSFTIAQRFSIGDRSGLLPGHTPFAQKPGKLSWHHCCVLVAL